MSDYSDQFKAVVLGSLLHDIGKFWQRADPEINYSKSQILSQRTKNNISNCCPVYKNNYSHKHSLWTDEFFEKYGQQFNNSFDDITGTGQDNPANLASYHHNPSTELQHLIRESDWMSSGMDRSIDEDYEIDNEIKSFRFRKVRLLSVFEKISFSDKTPEFHSAYNIESLKDPDAKIFPVAPEKLAPKHGEDLNEVYAKLWEGFISEFKHIPPTNFFLSIDALLSLLERYTWCIPSSTSDLPDISLYDHMKTTSAIASVLYKWHEYQDNFSISLVKDREKEKFLLIGGDLSGIQKYLFDLVHSNIKKVTKILRARSFYLSLLPKMIINRILLDLKLSPANNIMDAGGRFILLVPNIPDVKKYLKNINNKLKKWCLDEFQGEFTINLNWTTTLSSNDFYKERGFTDKMTELNHKLEIDKITNLAFLKDEQWSNDTMLLSRDYDSLLSNDMELCEVCGKKPARQRIKLENEDETHLCKTCYQHSIMGEKITKSSIIAYTENKPDTLCYSILNGEDRLSAYLTKNSDLWKTENAVISMEKLSESGTSEVTLKRSFIANHVPRFNEEEVNSYLNYYKNAKPEEVAHIKSGNLKTFSEIAIPPNKLKQGDALNKGSHLLGIIKADVDNLGLIFSKGLRGKVSVSRYATLSRMMNVFFGGFINRMLEETSEFRNIYTVYSGGDDLFLIGYWEDVIKLAPAINEAFNKFTCMNPDIHLSAAISLIKSRWPVNKAAESAEKALKNAKDNGRNQLSVFNTLVNWKDIKKYEEWMRFFDEAVNKIDSNINTSFLNRILYYQGLANKYITDNDVSGLLYLSKLSYDIKRNIEQKKRNVILNQEELDQLQRLMNVHGDNMDIKYIHIPIFYTLYKYRGGRHE